MMYLTNEQSGGSGAGLAPLVDFYSKLPKGRATPRLSGIKGRFFNGKNASGTPLAVLILTIFGISYTLDYNSAFSFLVPSINCSDHVPFLVHLSTYPLLGLLCDNPHHFSRTSQESRALNVVAISEDKSAGMVFYGIERPVNRILISCQHLIDNEG
jgi:hypothetical protein